MLRVPLILYCFLDPSRMRVPSIQSPGSTAQATTVNAYHAKYATNACESHRDFHQFSFVTALWILGTMVRKGGGQPPDFSEQPKKRAYVKAGTLRVMNNAPGGPRNSYFVVRGLSSAFASAVMVGVEGKAGSELQTKSQTRVTSAQRVIVRSIIFVYFPSMVLSKYLIPGDVGLGRKLNMTIACLQCLLSSLDGSNIRFTIHCEASHAPCRTFKYCAAVSLSMAVSLPRMRELFSHRTWLSEKNPTLST